MKIYFKSILLAVLVLIITACAAGSALLKPGSEDVGWIFTDPFDPIQIEVATDISRSVETTIPVEGGMLSTTGADGTVYTLEIPADALLVETVISMTPVSSIADMPFGNEKTYAVQLGPEGLQLLNFAILTIVPAVEIPINEQIFFGYQGEGNNLTLAMPVLNSKEVKIQLIHFSGSGVTKGLLADIEPVRKRLGGDAESRLSSELSQELMRLRQKDANGEETSAAIEAALQQYEELVVKPRVAAAGESCAAGQLAIQTVFRFERYRQLMGFSDGGGGLDNYPGLMDIAAQVCVKEEYEICVEQHVIHRMIPVWLGFERQYALLGMADSAVLIEARELTIKCLTFKLQFESTGVLNVEGGGYESTVNSEITLRFNPDEFTIKGEAILVNEKFKFYDPPNCSAISTPGDGTFEVMSLKYIDNGPNLENEYGNVKDFILSYLPGTTTESVIITCQGFDMNMPIPGWMGVFLATHIDELDTGSISGGGFVITDWEILGNEYFAKKEWIMESDEMIETGTFKLYHRPGE